MALDWLKSVNESGWGIPTSVPYRCVHSQCEVATCTQCVDICPANAWQFNEAGLSINPQLCDSCGLCVAACPESALEQHLQPARRLLEGEKTLLFACERTRRGVTGEGFVPCLYAISNEQILTHYAASYHQIITSRGHCESCPRHTGQDIFQQNLDRINSLLASRQASLIQHTSIAFEDWEQSVKNLSEVPTNADHSNRRQFLRNAITYAVETGMESVGIKAEEEQQPTIAPTWPSLLPSPPAENKNALYAFIPKLRKELCNGCDACVRLCPHEAISLYKNSQGQIAAYYIRPDQCTGCGICVDSCDQEAVDIQSLQVLAQKFIPLMHGKCKACGSPFHYPVLENTKHIYCRICERKNHHSQLFQVY